ncbi:CheY-like chemotaxis protein/signal transduction histidine kinase/CHASE3 domain sensor protein [Flavobacterium sp. CG_9.10]|uniref:response regulator n=1 Tax=Flavobacterium sp. CG_9.10 TaxID=2787729 RepID=UPI0018CA2E19|nr:response regulator [Flavobacterium sp. CG_9.10]MBG6111622.1 CheY-like chemotaxis protein/signal transduction histidine kinase/CHASE3 domain sensor protein [Flavobacterium sp. CG_9.10]
MKMTLGKKIATGFIACAVVLLGVAIFSVKNNEKFIASNTLVNHSNNVLYEFGQILLLTVDAETGVRGYVVTGDVDFLQPFTSANVKLIEQLNKVKEITKDNPIQQNNVEELTKEIKIHFDNLSKVIALRKKDYEKAKEFVASGEGKQIQDEIRKIVDQAQETENILLTERIQASEEDASKFNIVFVILLLIISLILVVVYHIVATNLKALKSSESENASKNWLLTGNAELNEKLIGDQSIVELANNTIRFLCTYLKANIGAVYLFNDKENALILSGKFAFTPAEGTKENFKLNEGLIGQAAWEQKQISFTTTNEDQIRITSSILNAKPKNILITPFLLDGKTIGVIEMGKLTDFNETEKEFITVSMNSIAISVNTVQQAEEKEKRAAELGIANKELAYQNDEKEKRADELGIANKELAYQNDEKEKRAAELGIANKELAYQNDEKEKRAAELGIANKELAYQNDEKEKRAAELGIANKELAYQNDEKEKRAAELGIANKELAYQNDEKEKRAAELGIANKELAYQNDEKEKRADELGIANKELAYQNDEKEKRAAELGIANTELVYQNDEKEKRAAELGIANKELAFQNEEKEKRAVELHFVNKELSTQAEELQIQQEELRQLNEELEQQAQNLKQQQEELQMTNEELEVQTQSLEERNKEVEASKNDIEQKTKQLEISSRYKSEFLANMSHELRTPLNSLLILSKDLSENRKKNLDEVQVESAEIIYKSGHDLLVLINEVLDLSKIEAGKMSINVEKVSLKNFTDDLLLNFKHQAEQKGLKLTCQLANNLPEFIHTDSQRLNQILKNLLSNAIKFTEKGSVTIRIDRNTKTSLNISVTDTGIGISEDKQTTIFEAFQQAEGGTSRKYGGTGLGLSISRELAKLLESEIKVNSNPEEGSTFSLLIPLEIHPEQEPANTIPLQPIPYIPRSGNDVNYLNYSTIEDDRDTINPTDKVLLIIEDDKNFAGILLKQANKKGFKCLSAATGEDGLLLATKFIPQAIILDIGLPGIKGKQVLQELKADPSVRHIPVHIISANDRSLEPIREGAVEYLMKPISKDALEEAFNRIENFVNRKIKNLLIIEDNENSRKAIKILIGNGDVKCFEAGTGKEALEIYQQNQIDCVILDIGLPDMSGFDLIHKLEDIKGRNLPPIIVYTGKELTKEENDLLHKYAESIIIKGIKSEERLLDETALFLHRTISNLPKSKQTIINNLHDKEAIFHSKKILLVDDDMRNVFALSKILQERGMDVIKSENGKNALEMLDKHTNIDLVLMDIMMPEMDGYEAMKRIRSQVKFRNLPVIALTAKAMKDDKQKCIDAGANDYITKPIDVERLLSLMRVWLSK